MPPVTDDDVIQQSDAEQLTGLFQPRRDLSIFRAGSRISAGMVVHQQQSRRRGQQHRLEDIPRVHDAGVQAAGGDGVQAEESILAVEVDRLEMLSGFPTEEVEEIDYVVR